ncbi:MFS transporter [Erythrobacter donghaensis]|uniref:MFS transporter n=1 Tax=Erythrobacter donghaensis TaxID=267135 RepID=UPI000A3B7723|nr:MFS transporter [Erythrobacter donghaensis]
MSVAIPVTAAQARPPLPALSEHKIARFAAIIVLYFLQGVPLGLVLVALPGWLAENGATPLQVGGFVGIAMLPWSTKLLNGLVMDRFTFKPMGRRRGWILLAQGLMVAALIAMAVVAPGVKDIALLTGFCFVLNVCVTFADVAVDGMAVDIVPDDERTAINSLMFASQSFGIAVCSFLAGQLLASGTMTQMALVLASMVACASAFVALFRERPGERLLPWTAGQASPECEARQNSAWWPILSGVVRSVIAPRTLLFLLGTGCACAGFAFIDAVNPTLAVQHLGWTSERYSSLNALLSLIAAGFALVTPILLVRWFGLRRTIIGHFLAIAALAALAGASFAGWQGDTLFMALTASIYVLSVLLTVLHIVWAMRISNPAIAASQFALFMAVPNLARSIMSGNSGWVVEHGGYATTYGVVAGIVLLGLVFCLLARVGDERQLPA